MRAVKPNHQSQRKDAVRYYTTQHVPGTHLNFSQRQTLASDWNAIVRAGCRITLRQFAAKHGLKYETWRREYHRGAVGVAVPDPKDRRRRKYAEYDPFKAQDEINENNANKGTRMLVTNQMAFLFKRHVIDEKLSPYDALCRMKKEMPGQNIPCLSTWYWDKRSDRSSHYVLDVLPHGYERSGFHIVVSPIGDKIFNRLPCLWKPLHFVKDDQ